MKKTATERFDRVFESLFDSVFVEIFPKGKLQEKRLALCDRLGVFYYFGGEIIKGLEDKNKKLKRRIESLEEKK